MSSTAVTISAADVKKVAHLARLRLDERDIATHIDNFTKILGLITEINAYDTQDVIPMTSPCQNATLHLRPDTAVENDQRQLLQRLAPQMESGLYLVPKVIE